MFDHFHQLCESVNSGRFVTYHAITGIKMLQPKWRRMKCGQQDLIYCLMLKQNEVLHNMWGDEHKLLTFTYSISSLRLYEKIGTNPEGSFKVEHMSTFQCHEIYKYPNLVISVMFSQTNLQDPWRINILTKSSPANND